MLSGVREMCWCKIGVRMSFTFMVQDSKCNGCNNEAINNLKENRCGKKSV